MSDTSSTPSAPSATATRNTIIFREINHMLPEETRKKFQLIEHIIETDEERLQKVYADIEQSDVSINEVFRIIEHALNIRFKHTESLLVLFSLLSNKYGYDDDHTDDLTDRVYSLLVNKGLIEYDLDEWGLVYYEKFSDDVFITFIQDNVDTFIEKSSETTFNAKEMIEIDSSSPLYYVKKSGSVSYLQAMAYFGAVKCLKYAILNDDYSLKDVEGYAVAGGNMEIIHLLEQKGISFSNCLEVAIMFHRNEICDWILLHEEWQVSAFDESLKFYNYSAFLFKTFNDVE